MNHQTFPPHEALKALIKYHWTLEVPYQPNVQKQRIVPDGCLDMIFILGDDVKRYVNQETYILQPRAMVLGPISAPFFIEPTGHVKSFAVCFYPYGFSNFVPTALHELANQETPLHDLFGERTAHKLEQAIIRAADTNQRIQVVEEFLFERLQETSTIQNIVQTTIDTLLQTQGKTTIKSIVKDDAALKKQLARKFLKEVGLSPKQLGRMIRLQTALKMIINHEDKNLTHIAYDSGYYDQSHFIKDFKAFTGTNPSDFLDDEQLLLSSALYE